MLCTTHRVPMLKQKGKYHIYCPECDRLAVAEAKRVFCKLKVSGLMEPKFDVVCCDCGVSFKAKTSRKKYCPPCLETRSIEGNRRRAGRYYIPVSLRLDEL